MVDLPSVSVVIPCYNAAKTIKRSIDSVLNQQCVREVIVSDDGSTDGTMEIVASMGDRVRFITGPNGGAPAARNRGALASKSKYLLFLDSDDYVDASYVDALAKMVSFETQIVMGPYRRVSNTGKVYDETIYVEGLSPIEALAEYLNKPTQTGAFLWGKAFFKDIGGWNEGLAIYQDAEITMRGLLNAKYIKVVSNINLFAYWLDNDAEHRLSNKFSENKALSTLSALNEHKSKILSTNCNYAVLGLATRYYSLARLCFKNKHKLIGRESLKNYRDLGYKKDQGSVYHRFLCSLIGLENKTAVIEFASNFRR